MPQKKCYISAYSFRRPASRTCCTHLSPFYHLSPSGCSMCINIKKNLKAPNFQGKKKSPAFRQGNWGREDLLVSHNLLCEACCTAQDTQAVSEGEGIDGQVDSESATRCLAGDIEEFVEEHIVEHTIADE